MGGGEPGQKGGRTGDVQEVGEEGTGRGTPKLAGIGRKWENYATWGMSCSHKIAEGGTRD